MSDTENFDVFKHKNLLEKKNSGLIFFFFNAQIYFFLFICVLLTCALCVPSASGCQKMMLTFPEEELPMVMGAGNLISAVWAWTKLSKCNSAASSSFPE